MRSCSPATWPRSRRSPAEAWALAALSGVVYYSLAFWCYLAGLRRVSASQAGAFINLVPVFALAGAFILLGETLAPVQCLGAALVLSAVAGLNMKRPAELLRPRRVAPEKSA